MSTAEASLSGVVTAKSSGEPLSGVSVAIFNNSTNQKLSATTDSTGAYSIQSIPVGTYNIEVEGDDYGATDKDDVSLPAGNTVMDFQMTKSGNIPGIPNQTPVKLRITGTVVSEGMTETDGNQTIVLVPTTTVSGVTVTAKNLDTGAVLGTTTSGSNGTFSIEIPVVDNEVTVPGQYSIVNENEVGIAADGSVVQGETIG